MLTSSNYNYEFSNVIRNKRRNEEILSEGYDKSSDSYMFPSGNFNNFSDAVIKENLFCRLGTVEKGHPDIVPSYALNASESFYLSNYKNQ